MTCTFVNTGRGKIIIEKKTIGGFGTFTFNSTPSLGADLGDHGQRVQSQVGDQEQRGTWHLRRHGSGADRLGPDEFELRGSDQRQHD